MEKPSPPIATLLLAAWGVVNLSGCSLVGFAVGAAGDSTVPDEYVYSSSGVDSIKSGRKITVTTTGGSTIAGEYVGLDSLPEPPYAGVYAEFLAASPLAIRFPAQGDSVRIVTHGGLGRGEQQGEFIGMSEDLLTLRSPKYGRDVGVLLEFIDTVYHGRGSTIGGDSLRAYVLSGDVPLQRPPTVRLLVGRDKETTAIPLDQIREVRSPNQHYQKWIGLGIGIAIDCIMVWALSDWDMFSGTGVGSPYGKR